MDAINGLRTISGTVGDIFFALANASTKIPLIGNWCSIPFYDVAQSAYMTSVHLSSVDSWSALVDSALNRILPWDTIKSYILGSWTWLNTIDDKIVNRAKAVWTWLDTIDDKIVARAKSVWTWLDTIDDKIVNRAKAVWTWLDTIDDKISNRVRSAWSWVDRMSDTFIDDAQRAIDKVRNLDDTIKDVAWNYVRDKIRPWIIDHLMDWALDIAKFGYSVLSYIWNLEWDDDNKEVKS